LEETEPTPVRIRWVRQSAPSPTGVGSRETRLQQPSPFEARRDPQPRPIPWAKLGPPSWRRLPRRQGILNRRTGTSLGRGHQEDFAKSANFRSRIRLPIPLHRGGAAGVVASPLRACFTPSETCPQSSQDPRKRWTEKGIRFSRMLARSHLMESGAQAIRSRLKTDSGTFRGVAEIKR
jgi:hypothetical protein